MKSISLFLAKIFIIIIIISFSLPGYARKRLQIGKEKPIEQSATLPETSQVIKKALTDPAEIRIPDKIGVVKETWVPKVRSTDRILIHVQDAHCNYEAQNNIAQILDKLMGEYGDQLTLVAVEGSVGIIDTSPFAEFSDAEIKKEVADYFMKKGKITGPEFLSITGDHSFTIYGIERKDLYDRNYKAFLDSLPFRDESEKVCGNLLGILNQLKGHIYSKELKEYDQQLKGYHDGETSFLDYVAILEKWAGKEGVSLAQFPNFAILQQVQKIEKGIDFKKVERERSRLIDKLGKLLGKTQKQDLVLKSLHFKLGKMTPAEYYNYLQEMIKDHSGIAQADYPDLFGYMEYVSLNDKMDKTKLFKECTAVETLIAEKLFADENQRKLFTLSRHVGMLHRMFKLELVKEDYLYFKEHKGEFQVDTFMEFIKIQAPRFGVAFTEDASMYDIDKNMPIIEEFYEAAIVRDDVLVNNTLARMERDGVEISVIITGGFHTPGITDIFREKDIAYAVISPMITKVQEYNPYIDIMTNKKTPFEEFLEQLGE